MKVINKEEMSDWAYSQCVDGNDTEEMRNLITESKNALRYCQFIKDDEKIRNRISVENDIVEYCRSVKCRPELYHRLNNKYHIINICKSFPEIINYFKNIINSSEMAYNFT